MSSLIAGLREARVSSMAAMIYVVAFGVVGGVGALCIRLQTPGETFLKLPDGLRGKYLRLVMGFLLYGSDLILGVISAELRQF